MTYTGWLKKVSCCTVSKLFWATLYKRTSLKRLGRAGTSEGRCMKRKREKTERVDSKVQSTLRSQWNVRLERAVSGRFSPLRSRSTTSRSALRSRSIVFCHAHSTLRSAQCSRSAHMCLWHCCRRWIRWIRRTSTGYRKPNRRATHHATDATPTVLCCVVVNRKLWWSCAYAEQCKIDDSFMWTTK